ncbi:thioesterase, FlK family [Euzebya tangerina]|uniref:thioesterase, FlK family n=1 Tax=Euzebya tangerina TaxID=591198 RepID=UPI000E31DF34|nr:hotdog domain-containing protein [Euzebya tangerina]
MRSTVADDDRPTGAPADREGTYGTGAMIRDVEEVSRFISSLMMGEGSYPEVAAVSLEHHFAVPVGSAVELRATVTEASSHKMVTDVVIKAGDRAAASATLTQTLPESG